MIAASVKMFSPRDPTNNAISIALVDDHELIHLGVKSVLTGEAGIQLNGEGYCGDHVWEIVHSIRPDVLLLDVEMPLSPGDRKNFPVLQTVRTLLTDYLTKPLILSHKDDPTLIRLLCQEGLQGFIHKEDIYGSSRNLANAIRTIARSSRCYFSDIIQQRLEEYGLDTDIPALTPRRLEILQTVSDNAELTYEQIAMNMGLSRSTVTNTMAAVMKTLDTTNKVETIIKAARLDLIKL